MVTGVDSVSSRTPYVLAATCCAVTSLALYIWSNSYPKGPARWHLRRVAKITLGASLFSLFIAWWKKPAAQHKPRREVKVQRKMINLEKAGFRNHETWSEFLTKVPKDQLIVTQSNHAFTKKEMQRLIDECRQKNIRLYNPYFGVDSTFDEKEEKTIRQQALDEQYWASRLRKSTTLDQLDDLDNLPSKYKDIEIRGKKLGSVLGNHEVVSTDEFRKICNEAADQIIKESDAPAQ